MKSRFSLCISYCFSYRAAISPFKQDREAQFRGSDTFYKTGKKSPLDDNRATMSRSFHKSAGKSLNKDSFGTGITPSEELVQILKRRGFTFDNL